MTTASDIVTRVFRDQSIVGNEILGYQATGLPFSSVFVFRGTRLNGEPETLMYLYMSTRGFSAPGRLVAALGYRDDDAARSALLRMLVEKNG